MRNFHRKSLSFSVPSRQETFLTRVSEQIVEEQKEIFIALPAHMPRRFVEVFQFSLSSIRQARQQDAIVSTPCTKAGSEL